MMSILQLLLSAGGTAHGVNQDGRLSDSTDNSAPVSSGVDGQLLLQLAELAQVPRAGIETPRLCCQSLHPKPLNPKPLHP